MSTDTDVFMVWLDGGGAIYWIAQVLFVVLFSGVMLGWLSRAARKASDAR